MVKTTMSGSSGLEGGVSMGSTGIDVLDVFSVFTSCSVSL
jgi:hypothetical protein